MNDLEVKATDLEKKTLKLLVNFVEAKCNSDKPLSCDLL